ncbi:hypothetical protein PLESTB_001281700 [Pleodorina starrii]|uniref:Uncharacterized protein n=1 Tax=Pleodorina starrii TaxID=330485 RepID=A0A9W6BTB9_9CHLO|nr:hypothetical protein PLESTM_001942700 [Pleodorina starrii]GLC57857.1 hypothetical protein PLESTB_001281700 [Pleodorina starrii]GLC69926.1 hypothetical protein PLESTF_000899400 [Pleodorina starrii]
MSKRPKDPDAFERKVKPIYDALDSRNWKGALKLCQQALQKYPDNELVKVLKAIGLERCGKRDEANQVVDEVLAVSPTDEQVLRLGAMVLRAAGRLPDITRMYEAAAAAVAPRGGELALVLQHEVFGAHVREFNFVKQQQVALKLSKAAAATPAVAVSAPGGGPAVSVERYGWWVVLSILLQARAALRARATGVPAPSGQVPAVALEPEKLMALGEGMVARQAAKDGRLEGYEALMVYVDVLLAQGKVSEALGLVSGPLGASAIRLPAERLQLRAVLSGLSGDLEGAAGLLREGLELNPDDWGALLLLLDCLLPGTAATAATTTKAAAAAATHGSTSPADGPPAPSPSPAPAIFTPQHPLVLISGGLAEQLPPRGVQLPQDGGCTPEAFSRAEAVLQELVGLAGRVSSEEGGGGGGKAMTMRGPDLALVDLACRRHRAATAAAAGGGGAPDGGADTESAVVDAVLSYYRKYGSLVSCAVDLRSYVAQLGPDAAARLAEAIQAEADAAAATAAAADGGNGGGAALSALRRRVCAAQIRDDLGLPRLGSCEEGVQLAGELLELYGTAQPLQIGLDERERGAADELPVLAAAALVSAAALAPSDAAAVPYLLAAYGALADAVRCRPYGAAMRIAAAALAALLGAPAATAAHLNKLDIKHIQLDTLASHLLLPALLAWPHWGPSGGGGGGGSEASTAAAADPVAGSQGQGSQSQSQSQQLLGRALRDSTALFEDHSRDAGETLFTAYGHGMYTKVLEFTAFRERLAASHTLAVVRGEMALAESLRGTGGSSTSSGTSSSSSGGGGGSGGEGVLAPDAMRVAAVAAAARLPPDDLPTAARLRFNWDLSTRPTWLPPCTAGPSAAVAEWWRSRGRGEICGQGYGRCWWSSTSSAESPTCPAAAAWRRCQATEAAHRWLLPHCIAGAVMAAASAAGGGAGQTQPGVLSLREAVERLRGLSAHDGGAASDAASDAAAAATTGCTTVPGSYELRQLDLALYGAALAVQDCLAPPSTSASTAPAAAAAPPPPPMTDVAAAAAACEALRGLTAAVQRLVAAAVAGVTAAAAAAGPWGGVLPGGSLAALSAVLREQMPVAAACVQSWQAALKALRKRRTKTGSGSLEEAAQRLADGVAAAAEALAAAARDCGEALAAAAAAGASAGGGEGAGSARLSAAAAAAQAVAYLREHGAPALSDAAATSLEGLVREQRATLAALSRQAAAVAAALT